MAGMHPPAVGLASFPGSAPALGLIVAARPRVATTTISPGATGDLIGMAAGSWWCMATMVSWCCMGPLPSVTEIVNSGEQAEEGLD